MTAAYMHRNQYEAMELDGDWMILNTDDYTITKLNAMGGFCWSLLHESQTLQSLAKAVCEHFESVSVTVEEDLEAFLNHLLECGLLKHAG